MLDPYIFHGTASCSVIDGDSQASQSVAHSCALHELRSWTRSKKLPVHANMPLNWPEFTIHTPLLGSQQSCWNPSSQTSNCSDPRRKDQKLEKLPSGGHWTSTMGWYALMRRFKVKAIKHTLSVSGSTTSSGGSSIEGRTRTQSNHRAVITASTTVMRPRGFSMKSRRALTLRQQGA